MSRVKKFAGFWILFLTVLIVVPGLFYLTSRWLDMTFGWSPLYLANMNLFGAALAVGAGLFWVFWAYSYLHFIGKGSPVEVFGKALYPTQALVTTGPYAYTRNPMMFGILLILLAIALGMASISALILIPILAVLAVLYVRRFEEPQLVHRFGPKYVNYRESVPALIPGSSR